MEASSNTSRLSPFSSTKIDISEASEAEELQTVVIRLKELNFPKPLEKIYHCRTLGDMKFKYIGNLDLKERPHGYGELISITDEGIIFKGKFCKGKIEGAGTYSFSDGKYTGNWLDGVPHGEGEKLYHNGNSYYGEFVNGFRHGQGKETYPDGSCYKGEFVNGYKHGKGKEKNVNGYTNYKGGFANDFRHGHGTINYSNGDVYKGEILLNNRQGKGTMIYANGTSYSGDWFQGWRHGKGISKSKTGKVYDGDWDFDNMTGKATITYADKSRFVGTVKNGELIEGILKTEKGDRPYKKLAEKDKNLKK